MERKILEAKNPMHGASTATSPHRNIVLNVIFNMFSSKDSNH